VRLPPATRLNRDRAERGEAGELEEGERAELNRLRREVTELVMSVMCSLDEYGGAGHGDLFVAQPVRPVSRQTG